MKTVYLGSDGRCYTEDEVWQRYESGAWEFCVGEEMTGQEIVRTDDGELLLLTPLGDGGKRVDIEG